MKVMANAQLITEAKYSKYSNISRDFEKCQQSQQMFIRSRNLEGDPMGVAN